VSNYMSLLHLLLSCGGWDMEIQEMVSQSKSNLPSFSTYVSQVSVFNTLMNIFCNQMILLQTKHDVFRLDILIHQVFSNTFKGCAWHFFYLKNSTQNMSSCHLHWIPPPSVSLTKPETMAIHLRAGGTRRHSQKPFHNWRRSLIILGWT
jgi:hypothetical protein